ncbi:MAG: alpha/beta fold hydrolase, partial [Henriciella sp.]|uniref:alpha/beta fold hydrolase n=1 Tax=Henriciella sp. TaxID=1968823 RepID=UPI003C773CF9
MTEDAITEAARALLAEMRPFAPSAAPGQNFLPPDTRRDIPGKSGSTPVWRAGDGPETTLFIHGWDDSHRVWRQFAMHFLQTGRPVLLMDLPGHGASKAETCNWQNASASIADVLEAEGPIETIIAHSFGARAATLAASGSPDLHSLVLIAPPLVSWADRQREKGVTEPVLERARALYVDQTGHDID